MLTAVPGDLQVPSLGRDLNLSVALCWDNHCCAHHCWAPSNDPHLRACWAMPLPCVFGTDSLSISKSGFSHRHKLALLSPPPVPQLLTVERVENSAKIQVECGVAWAGAGGFCLPWSTPSNNVDVIFKRYFVLCDSLKNTPFHSSYYMMPYPIVFHYAALQTKHCFHYIPLFILQRLMSQICSIYIFMAQF